MKESVKESIEDLIERIIKENNQIITDHMAVGVLIVCYETFIRENGYMNEDSTDDQ